MIFIILSLIFFSFLFFNFHVLITLIKSDSKHLSQRCPISRNSTQITLKTLEIAFSWSQIQTLTLELHVGTTS